MSEKLTKAQMTAAEAKLSGKTVRNAIKDLDAKEKATLKGVAIFKAVKKGRYVRN